MAVRTLYPFWFSARVSMSSSIQGGTTTTPIAADMSVEVEMSAYLGTGAGELNAAFPVNVGFTASLRVSSTTLSDVGELCDCIDFTAESPLVEFLPDNARLEFLPEAPLLEFRICARDGVILTPGPMRSGPAYETLDNNKPRVCDPGTGLLVPLPTTVDMEYDLDNLGTLATVSVTGGSDTQYTYAISSKSQPGQFVIDYDDLGRPVVAISDDAELAPGTHTVEITATNKCNDVVLEEKTFNITNGGYPGVGGSGTPDWGGVNCGGGPARPPRPQPNGNQSVFHMKCGDKVLKAGAAAGVLSATGTGPVKFRMHRSEDRRDFVRDNNNGKRFFLSRAGGWMSIVDLPPGRHSFEYSMWDKCRANADTYYVIVVPCDPKPEFKPVRDPCDSNTCDGFILGKVEVEGLTGKKVKYKYTDKGGLPLKDCLPDVIMSDSKDAGTYTVTAQVIQTYDDSTQRPAEADKHTFEVTKTFTFKVKILNCDGPTGSVPTPYMPYPGPDPDDQDGPPNISPSDFTHEVCQGEADALAGATHNFGPFVGAPAITHVNSLSGDATLDPATSGVQLTLPADLCAGKSHNSTVLIGFDNGSVAQYTLTVTCVCRCEEAGGTSGPVT